jgi:UDP-2-acetamido-2,6-beta-L-arabino-hexul-4-ose reductase
MNILITGAAGFVGKNLTAALQCMADGRDRRYPELNIEKLYLYDKDSPAEILEEGCEKADFVFHLAGVNRPEKTEEFMEGNFGFASKLVETLRKYGNTCPIMNSSSIQAALENPYERVKRPERT